MEAKHISSLNLETQSLPNRMTEAVSHNRKECFPGKGPWWDRNSLRTRSDPFTMESSSLPGICCPGRDGSSEIYRNLARLPTNLILVSLGCLRGLLRSENPASPVSLGGPHGALAWGRAWGHLTWCGRVPVGSVGTALLQHASQLQRRHQSREAQLRLRVPDLGAAAAVRLTAWRTSVCDLAPTSFQSALPQS